MQLLRLTCQCANQCGKFVILIMLYCPACPLYHKLDNNNRIGRAIIAQLHAQLGNPRNCKTG